MLLLYRLMSNRFSTAENYEQYMDCLEKGANINPNCFEILNNCISLLEKIRR